MKTCTLCKVEKPFSEFGPRKSTGDGLHFWCRPCAKLKKSAEYQKHREARLAQMKAYREANPEKVAACQRACYAKKPEQYKAKRKAQYQADPEAAKERARMWREENPERVAHTAAAYRKENAVEKRAYQLKYQRENRDSFNAYQNRYISERYQRDPLFALRMVCRRRLLCALSKSGYKKSTKTEMLMGCSFEELQAYIKAQFLPGMSWGNRGMFGWHLDHRVPLSSATTREEIERLSHYTNLQPMWAADNWAKGAKMPHEWEGANHGGSDHVQAERG